MDPKKKKIVVGVILGVLAIVVIWINFFSGGGGGREEQQAISNTDQAVAEIERTSAETKPPRQPTERELVAPKIETAPITKK